MQIQILLANNSIMDEKRSLIHSCVIDILYIFLNLHFWHLPMILKEEFSTKEIFFKSHSEHDSYRLGWSVFILQLYKVYCKNGAGFVLLFF